MKANKKKLLSILTAFVMAFTVFGCTGWAFAEETTGDDPEVQLMDEGEPAVVYTEEPAEEPAEAAAPEEEGNVELMGVLNPEGSAAAKTATLTWTAVDPSLVTEGWTAFYVVKNGSKTVAEPEETTYEVTGLKPNREYTFTIEAWEKKDDQKQKIEGVDPETVTVKTEVAQVAAPAAKTTTKAYRALTFNWAKVSPVNGGTLYYEIYTSDEETAKPIKTLSAKTLTWKRSGLSPRAKKYTYYVKAVEKDASGAVIEGSRSEATKLTGTPLGFQTRKLTGLVSDPGYKAVLLQWNKIDGATGYKIYWRKGGERGNIDTVGRDSDGHWMKTFRSSKTKKYVMPKKPGKYTYLTTVKQPTSGKLVKFDKRNLDIMNHTYVYFYQFMIIPYYDDDEGDAIYTSAVPENTYKSAALNKTTNAAAAKSNLKYNIVRNNTVLPMYVYETAKYNKPIYKTSSMNDGKKRGRLHKGHKFICWDKANGRVKFYGKKDGSGQPGETYWFAQKNAHTIQGYYMDNCRYGGKTNLKRKDWQTGYSKKTVLDYVNHCGIKSKTKYFVWASKYAQHVYILKKGSDGKWALLDGGKNRIPTNTKGCWSNLCATGKVSIQSRNGHYVIFGKQYKANRSAYDYFCLSKLHKTVRLHSLLYKNGKKFSSFQFKNKVLGNPISKGCIRLRPYAAQWIYKNVPKKTRTLVY